MTLGRGEGGVGLQPVLDVVTLSVLDVGLGPVEGPGLAGHEKQAQDHKSAQEHHFQQKVKFIDRRS